MIELIGFVQTKKEWGQEQNPGAPQTGDQLGGFKIRFELGELTLGQFSVLVVIYVKSNKL